MRSQTGTLLLLLDRHLIGYWVRFGFDCQTGCEMFLHIGTLCRNNMQTWRNPSTFPTTNMQMHSIGITLVHYPKSDYFDIMRVFGACSVHCVMLRMRCSCHRNRIRRRTNIYPFPHLHTWRALFAGSNATHIATCTSLITMCTYSNDAPVGSEQVLILVVWILTQTNELTRKLLFLARNWTDGDAKCFGGREFVWSDKQICHHNMRTWSSGRNAATTHTKLPSQRT